MYVYMMFFACLICRLSVMVFSLALGSRIMSSHPTVDALNSEATPAFDFDDELDEEEAAAAFPSPPAAYVVR